MFTVRDVARMSGVSQRRLRYVLDHQLVPYGIQIQSTPKKRGRRARVLGVVEAKLAILVSRLVSLGLLHSAITTGYAGLRRGVITNAPQVTATLTPFVSVQLATAALLEKFNTALSEQ